jgi:hypothetical protein
MLSKHLPLPSMLSLTPAPSTALIKALLVY